MPLFTPTVPAGPGAFTGNQPYTDIVDSTYGGLGGSYGVIDWRYGGYQRMHSPHAALTVGVFDPTSTASGAFTAHTPASTGVFTPS